jgi:putative flippase GtrA
MSPLIRLIVAPTSNLALQFARYLVAGVLCFVVDFSLLVLATEVAGISYRISAVLGFTGGLLASYWLSIGWVFNNRSLADKRAEIAVFFLIGILGLGLNEVVICVGTDIVGLDYRVSKIISVVMVLFWNFGSRRIILFRTQAGMTTSESRPIPAGQRLADSLSD